MSRKREEAYVGGGGSGPFGGPTVNSLFEVGGGIK